MRSNYFRQQDWEKLPLEIRAQIGQRERRVRKSTQAFQAALKHKVRFCHDEMLIPSTGRKKRRGRKWAKTFLLLVLLDTYLHFKGRKQEPKVHIL